MKGGLCYGAAARSDPGKTGGCRSLSGGKR